MPGTKLKFSEEVHAELKLDQSIVFGVDPSNTMPPPFAVVSVGVATLPIIILISATSNVALLIDVVVPLTVKFPDTIKSFVIVPPEIGKAPTSDADGI